METMSCGCAALNLAMLILRTACERKRQLHSSTKD